MSGHTCCPDTSSLGRLIDIASSQGSIHLADILLSLVPRAWKGKRWASETRSLLTAAALQMELSVPQWPFVALRTLPALLGPEGNRRHVQDHLLKDELVQSANRAGCSLTAR